MEKQRTKNDILKKTLIIQVFISIAVILVGILFGPNKSDGHHYVNLPVILIGIVMLFVGSFIISIAMLVNLIKEAKAYNKYLEENNIDEKQEEEAFKIY